MNPLCLHVARRTGATEGAAMIREQTINESGVRGDDPAYRNGWEDGRFGPSEPFLSNSNLAGWDGHRERLAFYRGLRDGRRVGEVLRAERRGLPPYAEGPTTRGAG